MDNVAIGTTDVGAALEQLSMAASVDSKYFSQMVEMNALLTRKLKEDQGGNTTLLEIVRTLGGSAPTKQNATEAYQKKNNRTNDIKRCYPNGYCFSCG